VYASSALESIAIRTGPHQTGQHRACRWTGKRPNEGLYWSFSLKQSYVKSNQEKSVESAVFFGTNEPRNLANQTAIACLESAVCFPRKKE
jgi:hypothetical protein